MVICGTFISNDEVSDKDDGDMSESEDKAVNNYPMVRILPKETSREQSILYGSISLHFYFILRLTWSRLRVSEYLA